MAHVLFVEDDEMIASGLQYALTQEGYQVTHCIGVKTALDAIHSQAFDLGLLDLSLPDGSGYTLCRILKAKDTPVVFLTAVDDEGNAVRGLEMGADDYITKPFRLRELLARVKGVLRRHGGDEPGSAVIAIGPDIQIHTLQAKVFKQGREIELTALEYRLLLVFANHKNQILTRTQLLENIWDVAGSFVNDNTLTVYMKRLRDKLEDDSKAPIIETVRGMGYRLHG